MYVVIICANCEGPSQVEESALGQLVECPLCGKPTLARTKAAVLPVAKPLSEPASHVSTRELLSLDDEPECFPSRKTVKKTGTGEKIRPKPSPARTAVYAALSLFLTLVLMGLIWKAFHYGSGDISAADWKKFKPPDGKCEISLPGDPEVEDIPAEGFGVLGGKRFIVERWFERVRAGFGWIDLDADQFLGVKFDQIALPFRDRELKRLNGKLTVEGTVNFKVGKRPFESRIYQMDTDKGKAIVQIYFDADPARLPYHEKIERVKAPILIFAPRGIGGGGLWLTAEIEVDQKRRVVGGGQRLRLYFAIAEGKKIAADTAWVLKFFNSFVPE